MLRRSCSPTQLPCPSGRVPLCLWASKNELVRADRRTPPLLAWERVDAHPHLAVPAAIGLMVAIALAIFGMPPVNLHGPLHFARIMDPMCGMTRAVASLVRGDLARAIWYNPASPVVLLGGVAALARGVYGRRAGRWLNVSWRSPARITMVVILVTALEVNQQMHADRLLS